MPTKQLILFAMIAIVVPGGVTADDKGDRSQPLHKLSGDAAELKTLFNKDANHPRLLLLLSPG